MPNKKSAKRLQIEAYCKQYSNWKDNTLAIKIFKENPGDFKSKERVRDTIRLIRGHQGNRHRTQATQPKPLSHDTNNWKPFKEEVSTSARVLILDIETAPLRVYSWNVWQQNIATNQIISDWFCLTWAAKWLFEDKVYSGKLTSKEALNQDDKRMIKGVWELLNKADIVIAHNGEKFDVPRLNTRFLIHGFNPPLPFQQIDTLKHIRRQFSIVHNKLDYVNQLLNLTRKQENEGFPMWDGCMKGNKESIDKMHSYNVQDVRILEETYLRIRAWIKPHPNMALHILDETQSRCPSCGSEKLIAEGKDYHTTANVYEQYRCDNCGGISRKRLTKVDLKQKRHLILSVPR